MSVHDYSFVSCTILFTSISADMCQVLVLTFARELWRPLRGHTARDARTVRLIFASSLRVPWCPFQ
jgi:hypothetical protein